MTGSVESLKHPMEHVWHHLNDPSSGAMNGLSAMIDCDEWRSPGSLTSVRSGSSLLIAGDYGGDHQGAAYSVYSLLLADETNLQGWDQRRQYVRLKVLRDNREMAYKKLKDIRRTRALEPFLEASCELKGLLLNVLIRKDVPVFQPDAGDTKDLITDISDWKDSTLNRICAIAHIGGLLLSCMSRPGQDVNWLSDQDEIAANSVRYIAARDILANVSSTYLRHDLNTFSFRTIGTADDPSMKYPDLLAIPDLAAGALSDILSDAKSRGTMASDGLWRPLDVGQKSKAQSIFNWLKAHDGTLARVVFALDAGDKPGALKVQKIRFL